MYIVQYLGKDVSCLLILIQKTQIHPARIFKAAFDYRELRWSPRDMKELYNECMCDGNIPIFVEDFALDCLAGRTRLNPLGQKLLEGKK